jgi:Protein of unknown function (DUF4038)/Putative collagen-binding domain of a collagenase
MCNVDASRRWLVPIVALALVACNGAADQIDAPPPATTALSTTGASVPLTIASSSSEVAPVTTPRPVTVAPPAIADTVPPANADTATPPTRSKGSASPARWASGVSGRRVVDQFGDPYLMKVFSSWGMAQNLTDIEVTKALEALAGRGFNAVNVAVNGVGIQADWAKYVNVAGDGFFTGQPFASPLGAGWATVDHIVAETQRLGMTVLLSFFVSYGETGIGPDLSAVSDADAHDYGVAVASRYRDAPNIVWHVEADTGWQPEDPIGRRLDAVFHGIAETEVTPRLIVAEPYRDGTGYQMFISEEGSGDAGYAWLHLSTNAVYDYGDAAVEQFDAVWDEAGATGMPVWDSEPPYASATTYSGDARQQLRERNYATFIRGGSGINYGDEDWWPFGKGGLNSGGLEWFEVPDSDSTVDAQRAWSLIDAYVTDPTWTPDDGSFVTAGLGSGDTKAASGHSDSAGLVYTPGDTSLSVDLTIFTTEDVHIRWYDPTTGSTTDVGDFPTTGTQTVTHPGPNASGQPDWVLVVEAFTP